jgi:hypothetical protein
MNLCDRHVLWQVLAVACCWLATAVLVAACVAILVAKTDPSDARTSGGAVVAFLAALCAFFSAFFTLHNIKECIERRAVAAMEEDGDPLIPNATELEEVVSGNATAIQSNE